MRNKKIGFVGPMVGWKKGYVTTQSYIMSELLAREGFPVLSVSRSLFRIGRFIDIVLTLLNPRHSFKIIYLDIFGGRSFVVEDIASFIAQKRKIPLIMALHGGALPVFVKRFPKWSQRVLRRSHLLVAPSPYLARVFENFGYEVRIIPNMISLSTHAFYLKKSAFPKLLWMRTFDAPWNPLMAVRVLKLVLENFPDASLVMAGQDKGLLVKCRELACQLGVEKNIRFAGFLDPEQKKEEFGKADIFLNTNTIDNMPVAVIEAWAAGLPVVATNVGGIPDMMDHEQTGLLVPDNDDKGMADAVARLVREPLLVQRLCASGRKKAESYSWESIKPQWEAIFQELSA